MKALILLFFSLILIWDQAQAETDFKSEQEAVAKLRTYQSSDLAKDRQSREKHKLVIDQMFSDLKGSVAEIGKKKASEDLVQQLGRVALLTFENDPTNYAAEIIFPVYQKDKKDFEKKLQKLSEKEKAQLIEALSDYERELSEGNG